MGGQLLLCVLRSCCVCLAGQSPNRCTQAPTPNMCCLIHPAFLCVCLQCKEICVEVQDDFLKELRDLGDVCVCVCVQVTWQASSVPCSKPKSTITPATMHMKQR